MPVIRTAGLTPYTGGGSGYPAAFALTPRFSALPVSDAGGVTQFGAYIETLFPGGQTSHRHWHENEDEFLYLLDGELTLVEDDGPVTLRPGDAATWPAGVPNGHHIRNDTDRPATYLLVGTRAETEVGHYPDLDLVYRRENGVSRYTRRDGTPYPKEGER